MTNRLLAVLGALLALSLAAIAVAALYPATHGRSGAPVPSSAVDSTADNLVLVGRVAKIVDGDTIDVQLDSGLIRVRFDSIDAPEARQAWGGEATHALVQRAAGKKVELAVTDQDRYERLVATVYLDGENLNGWLVTQGHAWAYRAYLKDDSLLDREEEARQAKRGLWSLADAMPPWEWRHKGGRSSPDFDDRDDFEPPGPDAPTPNATCGAKRYCADMSSCPEAHFFLEQCGLSTLDGDHDGIPCERICP